VQERLGLPKIAVAEQVDVKLGQGHGVDAGAKGDGGRDGPRTRAVSRRARLAASEAYYSLRRGHDLWKGRAWGHRKRGADPRRAVVPRRTRPEPRARSRLDGLALPFRLTPMDVCQVSVPGFDELAIGNRPISETSAKLWRR
jgi:hypothetical protein